MKFAVLLLSLAIALGTANDAVADTVPISFDGPADPVDLGQGIDAFLQVHQAFCFRSPTDLPLRPNAVSHYFINIQDDASSRSVTETEHSQSSVNVGFQIGVVGASVNPESDEKTTSEVTQDDRSLLITVDFNSTTGHETLDNPQLNDFGKLVKDAGPRLFLQKCGAVIATRIDRSITIRSVIRIVSTDKAIRNEIQTKFKDTLGGNVYAVTASASFANSFDTIIKATHKRFQMSVQTFTRASNGVTGFDKFTQALRDVDKEPFAAAIKATSELFAAKNNDAGGVDSITFANYDSYFSDVQLLNWPLRRDAWIRAQSIKHFLVKLEPLRTAYPKFFARIEPDHSFADAASRRTCMAQEIDPIAYGFMSAPRTSGVSRFVCSTSHDEFLATEKYLDKYSENCLGAERGEEWLCSDKLLYYAIVDICSGDPKCGDVLTPGILRRETAQIFGEDILSKADFDAFVSTHPVQSPDKAIDHIMELLKGLQNAYYAPLSFHLIDDSGKELELGSLLPPNNGAQLYSNVEFRLKGIDIVADNGSETDVVFEKNHPLDLTTFNPLIWTVNPTAYYIQDGSRLLGKDVDPKNRDCSKILECARMFAQRMKASSFQVYLRADTVSGSARVLIGSALH